MNLRHTRTNRFSIYGILAFLLLLLASCKSPFNLDTVLGIDMEGLSVSPSEISISTGSTQLLTVEGGTAPYTWEIYAGQGSITGSISASETYDPGVDTGLVTLRVTDSDGIYGFAEIFVVDAAVTPDIDYTVSNVEVTAPTILSGGITAEFTHSNIGAIAGTSTVQWTAYVSTSTDESGIVSVVDSGNVAALDAGETMASSQPIGGNWPDNQGTYYILVRLSADSDSNINNNAGSSAPVSSSVSHYLCARPVDDTVNTDSTLNLSYEFSNSGSVGGVSAVSWKAFLSSDGFIGPGDLQVASGSFGALAGNDTVCQPVNITGNWPSTPGTYYLIMEWDSDDEALEQDSTPPEFSVEAPSIDYSIISVTDPGSTAIAGNAVSGTFSVQNLGPDDDPGEGFSWRVYASSDTTYGNDTEIDYGTETAMAVADSAKVVNYAGLWPETGADYYIVVVIDSTHDTDPANNENYNETGPTTVVNMTDYEISTVIYESSDTAGGPLNGTWEFTFTEIGGEISNKKVDYTVYASTDTILDGGDMVLKTNFISATEIIAASGSVTVPFSDGNDWPAGAGEYYIIVSINCGDDVDAANDRYIAGPVILN